MRSVSSLSESCAPHWSKRLPNQSAASACRPAPKSFMPKWANRVNSLFSSGKSPGFAACMSSRNCATPQRLCRSAPSRRSATRRRARTGNPWRRACRGAFMKQVGRCPERTNPRYDNWASGREGVAERSGRRWPWAPERLRGLPPGPTVVHPNASRLLGMALDQSQSGVSRARRGCNPKKARLFLFELSKKNRKEHKKSELSVFFTAGL